MYPFACISVFTTGPPKPTFLEIFMVNNLVFFRWPRPLFFMVLGAHGSDFSLQCHCSVYFHDLFGSDHGRLEDPHFLPDKTSWWRSDSRNEEGELFAFQTHGPRSHVGEVWRMIKIDEQVILMVWWCLLSLESYDSWDNIGTILEFELQLTFPGQMVSQLYAYMVRNDKRSFVSWSFVEQLLFLGGGFNYFLFVPMWGNFPIWL